MEFLIFDNSITSKVCSYPERSGSAWENLFSAQLIYQMRYHTGGGENVSLVQCKGGFVEILEIFDIHCFYFCRILMQSCHFYCSSRNIYLSRFLLFAAVSGTRLEDINILKDLKERKKIPSCFLHIRLFFYHHNLENIHTV